MFSFFIFILNAKRANSVFYILIITYISLCLITNLKPNNPSNDPEYLINISGLCYGLIGSGFTRGLVSIGFGILAAKLNNYLNFKKSKQLIVVFSLVEAFLIYKVIYWVVIAPTHISFLLIGISCLIISFYNSCGVISICLNKFSGISDVSKYTYSIFIMHSFPLIYFRNKIDSPMRFYFIVMFSSIVLGILIYHLVKKILPIIKIFK